MNAPIYRVFGIDRLYEIFSSFQNTLVRPKLWDDPFENFILEQAIRASEHQNADITIRDGYYGQCWSTLKESDAMWRIYSPDKNGVKVKATAKKLFDSLCNSPEVTEEKCFIGKVDYMEDNELRANLEDPDWLNLELVNTRSQANSFLFKRVEFMHEAEIRLLYCSGVRFEKTDNLFHYRINPHELFDEIVFDPRLPEAEYEKHKYRLEGDVMYPNLITQSTLYKLGNIQIRRV
jgi:hypothetical protein